MRPLKLIAIAIIFCLLAATFLVYVYPRYYILNGSRNGTDIAEEIIANKRSPIECSHVLDLDPFPSPSADEQSRLCVYIYAKLTQDPSICELLMPSDYGMSCIGQIWGKLIDESNCHWYKDNAVRCFEGIALTPHIYDCWGKNSVPLPDECKHRVAFREKKEDLCDGIAQPILRSVCKVRIGIWEKYPALRSTIYFKDNIE
jgi:hypothetical protein